MLANAPQVLEFLCCISVCVYVGGASHLAFCHSSWTSLCINVFAVLIVHGTGVCGGLCTCTQCYDFQQDMTLPLQLDSSFVYMYLMV